MPLSLKLFFEFFKVGLFSVGGGNATIPFLAQMSESTKWFTKAELADMVAIAEITPGPLGVNMATFVGYKTLGPAGGVIATLGLVFPSVIIITAISYLFYTYKDNRYVTRIFLMLRPISLALIVSAIVPIVALAMLSDGYVFGKNNIIAWVMAVVLFVLMNANKTTRKIHPIMWVALSALAGVLLF